jgi:hypothetical protein
VIAYADKEKMLKYLEENNTADEWIVGQYNADWIYSFIESQPDADVAEVVRCKDCKYYKVGNPNANYCYHERYEDLSQSASYEPDDFCSYGTPKERGGEK